MTTRQAKAEASHVKVQETRLVKNNSVFMCRLTNGITGFGSTREQANHEAYARCARAIMRAVNTGRIAHLSAEQIRKLDAALR
jgi:hypothetical protein